MELAAILASASTNTGFLSFFDPGSGLAAQVLKIVVIDLILSGDNAVLIALACRSLPTARLRRTGIILGAVVAIVLRIIFAGTVTQLLDVPYLHLVGGILLLMIAIKLVVGEDEDEPNVTAHDKLWRAVYTIALADVLMSLDNVIAIAAVAKGSVMLIAFGIALSIPLIIWGSTLVLLLIGRFPIIIWIGAALLGWIAGELIASEVVLQSTYAALANAIGITDITFHHALSLLGVVVTVAGGWIMMKWPRRPETTS